MIKHMHVKVVLSPSQTKVRADDIVKPRIVKEKCSLNIYDYILYIIRKLRQVLCQALH